MLNVGFTLKGKVNIFLKLNVMKTIRILCISSLFLILGLLASSCYITRKSEGNNRKPVGWFKNSNNPHHPATTNPGHTKWEKDKKNKHR